MTCGIILDEQSNPSLRSLIGSLLKNATRASFAVGHVRLGAIDLSAAELKDVKSCRLLLDRLDVEMLNEAAGVVADARPMAVNLSRLLDFIHSGRLEIRSSGSLCWSPDFSVLHGIPVSDTAPNGSVCLVGAHYFSRPVMIGGASLTCVLCSDAAVRIADTRFEELWDRAHDVMHVVRDLLTDALSEHT